MNELDDERLRLEEQLEAVTAQTATAQADAIGWMQKYKLAAAEAEEAKLTAAHLTDTVRRLQQASVVNENRVELLLNILSDYSARLRRDY